MHNCSLAVRARAFFHLPFYTCSQENLRHYVDRIFNVITTSGVRCPTVMCDIFFSLRESAATRFQGNRVHTSRDLELAAECCEAQTSLLLSLVVLVEFSVTLTSDQFCSFSYSVCEVRFHFTEFQKWMITEEFLSCLPDLDPFGHSAFPAICMSSFAFTSCSLSLVFERSQWQIGIGVDTMPPAGQWGTLQRHSTQTGER